MTGSDARQANRWRIGNNGVGARIWFLLRDQTDPARSTPYEYLETRTGQLVRFATAETAQRRADRLNAEVTP